MLFDLESNELLELNQDGNPTVENSTVENSTEESSTEENSTEENSTEENSTEENSTKENPTKESPTEEENSQKKKNSNQQGKKSKKKKKAGKNQGKKENPQKQDNKKVIEGEGKKEAKENIEEVEEILGREIEKDIEKDIDLEFIKIAKKSTSGDSEKTKKQKQQAKEGEKAPSEKKSLELPAGQKEEIEKAKKLALQAGENIKKTGDQAIKRAKPALEKAGDKLVATAKPALEKAAVQSKKLWATFKASAAKTGKNIKKDFSQGGFKRVIQKNRMTLTLGALLMVMGVGLYAIQFQSLPKLQETHTEGSSSNYKNYDAEAHPMEILSTVKSNMQEFKGEPSEIGDGKTEETRYVVYSMEWFGKNRKTVIYHDPTNTFSRIKLVIDNESAESLYEKLVNNLGKPLEESTPTVREGWAVWVKDSIRYKMMHRGSFTQLEMSIAKYDNSQNLDVGKYPIVVQNIQGIDLNGDGTVDEKILLLGNRNSSTDMAFSKLYLLVWDGKKTYLEEMEADYDGGKYPQLEWVDTNGDGQAELLVSAENNIVNNYNVFQYTGTALEKTYSGYEEPGHNEQEANQ